MKDVPLIDELRAVRSRLAQEQGLDAQRYAAMLREVAQTSPGQYVREPLLPKARVPLDAVAKTAG